MTIKEFLILGNICHRIDIEKLPKPKSINGNVVPESLNNLTMGDLIQLQDVRSEKDALLVPCRVLLGMNEKVVLKSEAGEVLGFVCWASREMKRINQLFASTSVPPTPEERKAGIEHLNFGVFGLLDYYAQRMGISNHEVVEQVPWVRVYKCLEMDSKRIMFQRRLQTIISKKK